MSIDQRTIRARYDFIARWHDAIGRFTMPHRRDALRALGAQPGERILDLACGAGANMPGLLAALDRSGWLVGIDDSPGMLAQAQRRLVRHSAPPRVSLLRSDAAWLPFADNAFDRVICTYALRVIPHYQRALDEVRRVLKPGGVFVVLDGKLSTGVSRFLNPLALWSAHGPLTDLRRPLEREIVRRFAGVQIQEYDWGHTFVAVARKP